MPSRPPLSLRLAVALVLAVATTGLKPPATTAAQDANLDRLLAAYPDQLERIEGNVLVWRDGARMEIDDGKGAKAFEAWLADPDIEDMLRLRYPAGMPAAAPDKNVDPGRARNFPFFRKMYGDCRKGEVARNLVEITWLPRKAPQR